MNEVNCLRNKIFIGIFSGFILLVMLAAPGKMILTNLGVIEAENVGNIIEVDKVYEEGTFGAAFFNGIEEVKRTVNDIYTNYIPFYVSITSTASSFQQSLNQPVTSFLMNKGNELMLKNLEASKKPTETEPPVSSGEETSARGGAYDGRRDCGAVLAAQRDGDFGYGQGIRCLLPEYCLEYSGRSGGCPGDCQRQLF